MSQQRINEGRYSFYQELAEKCRGFGISYTQVPVTALEDLLHDLALERERHRPMEDRIQWLEAELEIKNGDG